MRRPLKFDRADLAAVLFALKPALELLIIVELPFDAFAGAVEDIDDIPQQVLEIGLDAGLGKTACETVEHIGDRAAGEPGIGKREIGRASCRERVCQYVMVWVVAVSLKQKQNKSTNK